MQLQAPGAPESEARITCAAAVREQLPASHSFSCAHSARRARSRARAAGRPVPSMRISQLFILAPNGHTIVHRDYRGEVPKEASETFLRRILIRK